MESSTPKKIINVEAKHKGLCVGLGCVARCSNKNIVNKLKQEAPSNVGTNDLIMQEVLLENLKKQAKVWKPHHRTFHMRVFFKINNNLHVDLGQNQVMRCIVCHNETICIKILVLHTSCHNFDLND
jgi:hypothetical protein